MSSRARARDRCGFGWRAALPHQVLATLGMTFNLLLRPRPSRFRLRRHSRACSRHLSGRSGELLRRAEAGFEVLVTVDKRSSTLTRGAFSRAVRARTRQRRVTAARLFRRQELLDARVAIDDRGLVLKEAAGVGG